MGWFSRKAPRAPPWAWAFSPVSNTTPTWWKATTRCSCVAPPIPVGLATFVKVLQHGWINQQVIALIVGSPEYFAQASQGLFSESG
jgi:hypothetical protein